MGCSAINARECKAQQDSTMLKSRRAKGVMPQELLKYYCLHLLIHHAGRGAATGGGESGAGGQGFHHAPPRAAAAPHAAAPLLPLWRRGSGACIAGSEQSGCETDRLWAISRREQDVPQLCTQRDACEGFRGLRSAGCRPHISILQKSQWELFQAPTTGITSFFDILPRLDGTCP